MPPVVPCISSLVVYPDDALKQELRCPGCLYVIQLHTLHTVANVLGSVAGHFQPLSYIIGEVLQTTSGFSTHLRKAIVYSSIADP